MGYAEAAAIPQAAMLAVQGLIDAGRLQSGEKVLINGAGGGVGMYGIQIAKLFGAETTGVDSAAKLDFMKAIGFDHVMDYTREDFTKSNRKYDLILDAKTNRPVSEYSKVLAAGGRYVTVGGSMGRLLQVLILGKLTGRADKKQFSIVALKPNKDLEYMNRLFMEGRLRSFMEGPFPMESFMEPFRLFERAEHKGKVVISL
jgi:NADPH:quinone reductase-like Zn-dependent oxidoreductase